MPLGAHRASWDVTFLFPGGERSVFRCVPLQNIDSLCELTRCAAEAVLGTKIPVPHVDDDTLLPGFFVYHVPVKEKQHLGSEALRPTTKSWHSLCQRQPSGNRSIFLHIVPKNDTTRSSRTRRGMGSAMNSSSGKQFTDYMEDMHSKSFAGEHQDSDSTHNSFRNLDISPISSVRRSAFYSPKRRYDCVENPSFELNCSQRPSPPEVLTRLAKNSAPRPTSAYMPSSDNIGVAVHKNFLSVRMFALQFVLARIHEFLSNSMQEVMQKEGSQQGGVISLPRDAIIYLTAALVKDWQNSLALKYDMMDEAWSSLPPLLQNAQLHYLKCIVSKKLKRLRGELTCGLVKEFSPHPLSFEAPAWFSSVEPIHSVPHVLAEKTVWGIAEVTYCSASGPLCLPEKQAHVVDGSNPGGNNKSNSYDVALTLTAPSFISIPEELAVVGRICARHPINLFWWILDETDDSSEPFTVPLSDWHHQGRITTFEITPQFFTLNVKPGTLFAGHRYRLIAQVCDVHTGECASCELQLDGGHDTSGAYELDRGWAVAISRAYHETDELLDHEKTLPWGK